MAGHAAQAPKFMIGRSPIRVLIAEDHLIARIGVGAIVGTQPDMTVVAEAINGKQAVALYRKWRPDVVLTDMRMPVMDGYSAVAAIRTEFPAARFVALSIYGSDDDILRAFDAGVHAYLTKDVLRDELVTAIRAVYQGKRYLSGPIAGLLEARGSRPDLSARELEVLAAISKGFSNREIGEALHISEQTVKTHVKKIFDKLGVDDRTEAVMMSIQRGIIRVSDSTSSPATVIDRSRGR